MFAVIKTGGKQYVVREGDMLHVEKLGIDAGGTLLFEEVFLIDDDGNTIVGTPVVPNAVVKAVVLETFRDEKVLVFKKKRRKQFRRTRGHRQSLAKVQIQKIYPDRTTVAAGELDIIAAPVPEVVQVKTKVKINKATPKPKVEKPEAVKPAKTKKAAKTVKPMVRTKKAAK
jgi:large subunit ribosomal protein L21